MAIKRVPIVKGEIAFIPLTRGQYAMIDVADLPLVGQYNWIAAKGGKCCYAQTQIKRRTIQMHRMIIGCDTTGFIDHTNQNGLDNRRANLRVASRSQNKANSTRYSNNTSGVKGAYWNKAQKCWRASITCGGKLHYLGRFDSVEQAARAYDEAAKRLHGEFARLNFGE